MFLVKYYDIPIIRHKSLHSAVNKSEKHFRIIIGKGKEISSKIHFKNAHRLAVLIINFIKTEIIHLKRKFDSKQPKFFLQPQKQNDANKSSVSFFLKNVSEYKKSLRNKN